MIKLINILSEIKFINKPNAEVLIDLEMKILKDIQHDLNNKTKLHLLHKYFRGTSQIYNGDYASMTQDQINAVYKFQQQFKQENNL